MGDLTVVTGVPGHGKTTFVNDLLCRTIEEHGWKVAVASFEQHPRADHLTALRQWKLGGPVEVFSPVELREADQWVEDHFVFIHPIDDDEEHDLAWALDRAASAVVREGVRVVVFDPWNEIEHARSRDESLTEYTGRAIREFKRLARAKDVHVIVVAHPAKYDGRSPPTLYSVSDSAHWFNKPDAGIVVWKPDVTQPFADVMVVKSRYHDQIGKPGKAETRYNPVTRRFEHSPRPPQVTDGS